MGQFFYKSLFCLSFFVSLPTDMSEIQLDKVNLDNYKQIGEGGNGKTYVNPAAPGEILKVNNARISTWEAVKRE